MVSHICSQTGVLGATLGDPSQHLSYGANVPTTQPASTSCLPNTKEMNPFLAPKAQHDPGPLDVTGDQRE